MFVIVHLACCRDDDLTYRSFANGPSACMLQEVEFLRRDGNPATSSLWVQPVYG